MGVSNIIHGRIWFLGCALPVGPKVGSIGRLGAGEASAASGGDISCLSLSYSFLLFPVRVNEQLLLEMMMRPGDSLLPLQ